MKRTLKGSKLKKKRRSGFRSKLKTKGGRNTLKRKRLKGRKKLGVS